MTFEEWLDKYSNEHNEDLEGEDLELAREAWQAGYQAALDGWVNNKKG